MDGIYLGEFRVDLGGDTSLTEWFDVIVNLSNCKMAKGSPVGANLKIVLRHDRKWYVLENPIGIAPTANSPIAVRNAYRRHVSGLLDVGYTSLTEWFNVIVNLSNCKMAKGSPVGAYVIKMTGHISGLERLGSGRSRTPQHAQNGEIAIEQIGRCSSGSHRELWQERDLKPREGITAISMEKKGTSQELIQMVQLKRTRRILLRPQIRSEEEHWTEAAAAVHKES
nr:hypothetical protein [Tanacetum cinerariifolium]